MVVGKTFKELGEEVGAEFDVVVEEEDGFAAGCEGGVDALIVACGDSEVGGVWDEGDLGVLAAEGEGGIGGGVVDGPEMEGLGCLAIEGGEEAG